MPAPPPPSYGSASPPPPGFGQGVQYTRAGFGQRFGAWLLDALICGVPAGILFGVLAAVLPREDPQLCEDFDGELAVCEPFTGASTAIFFVLIAAAVLFYLFYYIGHLQGRGGGTPGKRIIGLRLVKSGTNEVVGMGRAVGRRLGEIISGIPCYLGYFWMLWDDKNQTWHDKMVDSEVIKT